MMIEIKCEHCRRMHELKGFDYLYIDSRRYKVSRMGFVWNENKDYTEIEFKLERSPNT